jgi:hypothetical protein
MSNLKSLSTFAAATAIGAFAVSGMAAANVIYDFTTGPNGNANQSATAEFNFADANHFTLTLTNTGTIIAIDSVLDDFSFTESGTLTTLALNSIADTGVIDCTASTNQASNCTKTTSNLDATGDWSLTKTGNNVSLVAGVGEHPYGIVNDTILGNGNLDGLRNQQHNPYLDGPVTFTFTSTGETSIPTISNVVFSFGTTPDFIAGVPVTPTPTPEPASLALLGSALAGLGLAVRRRRRVGK